MPINQRYYFDLVSDLRRVAFCISCKNIDGAEAFYIHARKIYFEHISTNKLRNIVFKDLDEWSNQFKQNSLPSDDYMRMRYADKILTISSIIFYRIYPYAFS